MKRKPLDPGKTYRVTMIDMESGKTTASMGPWYADEADRALDIKNPFFRIEVKEWK